MKKILAGLFVALLLMAPGVEAQIIIGPASTLAWEVVAATPVFAQSLTYVVTVDATPLTLTGVTCVTKDVTTQTCSVLASTIPAGSHNLTMTASDGTTTSAASLSFAYIVLAIPIPSNLRLRK